MQTIDEKEYREAALRLESRFPDGKLLPPPVATSLNNASEMVRASNAAVDKLKRHIFYGKPTEFGDTILVVGEIKLDERQVRIMHAAMGMLTEASELFEAVMDHIIDGMDLDEINLVEESGDIEWYQAVLHDVLYVEDSLVRVRNLAKLYKRYPGKFDQNAALTRDLAAERKELERET